MKHRITYVRPGKIEFDPKEQIDVEEDSIRLRPFLASKEYRLTIGFEELPREIVQVLEQCHELRVRWVSAERPLVTRGPFVSTISPGLHVFATPRKEDDDMNLLCPTIIKLFGQDVKCSTFREAFTTPSVLSTRFATVASAQFHSNAPSLETLVLYLQHKVCAKANTLCQEGSFSLLTADSLDIDFDVISHVLTVSAFWDSGPFHGIWSEKFVKPSNDRVEVGVFNEEKTNDKEEIKLGGWLMVLGEDSKPNPTLFSFPSRHHSLPSASFYTSFDTPTGLHPTLRLALPSPLPPPPYRNCALHAHLTLPSTLFLDPYAFTDKLFLRTHNLAALHSHSGARDLESPAWAISAWGSTALLTLRPRATSATIPLHLRYLPPAPFGHLNATLPVPAVFYACPSAAEPDTPTFATNPFDRTNLGFDGLFGDRTAFWHFAPLAVPTPAVSGEEVLELLHAIPVPVLDASWAGWVRLGTVGAVVAGFAAVLWALLRRRGGVGRKVGVEGEKVRERVKFKPKGKGKRA